MFKVTSRQLKTFKAIGVPMESININLTQKERTAILKEEKLKAKEILQRTTFEWRTENLRLREQNAREELTKLAEKQAKQLKIKQIEQEVTKKLDQEELEDKSL